MSKLSGLKRLVGGVPDWVALSGSNSSLRTSGWYASRARRQPIDAEGQPIPWITYASLAFLAPRVRSDMSVFEYGSGSSTLWWASRVRRVVACEHDKEWHELARKRVPQNVQIAHVDLADEQYAREILKYRDEFDVIVIDGRDRVRCALNCLTALKRDGVILWDNSERTEYRPGYDYLEGQGFRRLDFTGMGPINAYDWSTSLFYRSENCLGI
jgi:precorrin-6B methylase 2